MPAPRTTTRSHRPKALMVFAAAFVAGAAAAVGINRALDVHLAQSKPQVECEPIFVALRSLPQGTPVTIWDVALRDWPKAMMPTTALRATDEFEGLILRHPVREGQPLLSVQLVKADAPSGPATPPPTQVAQTIVPPSVAEADLWTATVEPSRPVTTATTAPAAQPATESVVSVAPAETVAEAAAPVAEPTAPVAATATPLVGEPTPAPDAVPPAQPEPAEAVSVVTGPAAPAPVISTPTEPAAPPAPESKAVVRYLVVPERIAMQADNSFVMPKAALAQAAAIDTTTTAPTVTSAPTARSTAGGTGGSTSVPPVLQDPGKRRPNAGSQTMKTHQSAKANQSAAAQRPQQQPQTPMTTRQPAQQRQPQPRPDQAQAGQPQQPRGMFGTLFPNLRAGIDAIENELGTSRRPQTEVAVQPEGGQQKVQPLPPAQKSARWPSSGTPRSF